MKLNTNPWHQPILNLLLCTCLLCLVAPARAQQLPATPEPSNTIAVRTELVSLAVTVTDNQGRLFTGLGREDFTIHENGIAQEVSHFSLTDSPASVAVVFDVSGSMSKDKIERARTALAHFVATSHGDDEYSLVAFNDRPQLLLERSRDDRALLNRAIHLRPKGGTALYDALALALAQLQQGRYAKRALLVISDGEDNRSRLSFDKVRRMAQEAGVLVYAVVIADAFTNRGEALRMEELANSAGGAAFFPGTADELNDAFARIALQLRQHYSLGYVPTNFNADGKWRKLKVKLKPLPGLPKLIVRNRTGYYASTDPLARELAQRSQAEIEQ